MYKVGDVVLLRHDLAHFTSGLAWRSTFEFAPVKVLWVGYNGSFRPLTEVKKEDTFYIIKYINKKSRWISQFASKYTAEEKKMDAERRIDGCVRVGTLVSYVDFSLIERNVSVASIMKHLLVDGADKSLLKFALAS